MKKGKKIWNRLLSLVLCLVMVTGMFAGMGMEAEAQDVWMDNVYRFVVTPGNTGQEFYNQLMDKIINTNGYYKSHKQYSYIATEYNNGGEHISIEDCKEYSFTTKRYELHCRTSNGYAEGNPNYIELWHIFRIDVIVAYSIGVSVSGAQDDGGITVNDKNYNGGEISPNSSLTFEVKNVTDYAPTVTFDGKTLSASNGTYTISKDDIANASDRTINVIYDLMNKSTITIDDPGHVIIEFNGSRDESQTVGKSGSYTILAKAHTGYLVTDILVDTNKVLSGNSTTLTLNNWQPTADSHTISAKVVKKEIKAKDGTIN